MDFKNLNLGDLMEQVQEMAQKAKDDGDSKLFTSKMGGGMIELSINGNSEVVDLKIDDSLMDDKDALKILLISAMNDVIKQADENKKTMAMNMMGGLNLFKS
jgi:nucleoid-associated protein EbfC